jgi:prevent-host-death family protein
MEECEHIGAFEAKTHLSELLQRVSQGEKIAITKHGVAIAVLSPVLSPAMQPVADTIAQLKSFRKKRHLGDLSLKKIIAEGRS